MQDHYAVLGVSPDADAQTVRQRYRALARELHPDRNLASPDSDAEERFKEVTAAYEVLSDPERRAAYDASRRRPSFTSNATAPGSYAFDFDEIFAARARPRRAPDVQLSLRLGLSDLLVSSERTFRAQLPSTCETCAGTGAGGLPTTCAACSGQGRSQLRDGMFSFARTCPECAGRGSVAPPCPSCEGSGVYPREREVRVRIPLGVRPGDTLRVPGQGVPAAGGEQGDLLLHLELDPHPQFTLEGSDLRTTALVPVTLLLLGGSLQVPTLTTPVTLRVPPASQPGLTLRVRGRGLPAGRTAAAGGGDLLVTLQPALPTSLTPEAQGRLAELEGLLDVPPSFRAPQRSTP